MATKLSMIVVTTSWAPETAFRKPGMKPHAAPKMHPGQQRRPGSRSSGGLSRSWTPTMTEPEGAHQELALDADVEQPGLEAEADGQAAEQRAASCC